MSPNPKTMRIKLTPKEYTKLRHRIYLKQYCCCIGCGGWLKFNHFSLHHKDTGGMGMKGDDTEENCDGYGLCCHPD